MKKLSIALSALLLMGMLTACGSDDNNASPAPSATASPKATVSPTASPGITNSVEEAGEDVKNSVEDTGDKMKEAGEDIKEDLTGENKNNE